MSTPEVPRRAKHLIDPNAPRQRPVQRDDERLTKVKQWVMSVLAVTTVMHLCVGLILAAVFTDEDRVDARVGLNVIAGILAVAAVAAGRAIHKKNPISIWLVLGVVPMLIGLAITFR